VVLEAPDYKKSNRIINKIEECNIARLNSNKLKELYGDYKSKYSSRLKIDTGFRCNAKCTYCYYLTKVNDEFIPKEEIITQINKAKELNFKSIEFSGGESTIHPDFLECVSYAKSLGLITSVITNGYLNHEEIRSIIDRGIDEIMFSIHGFRDTHDKIVKLDKAYEKIFSNLRVIHNHPSNVKARLNIIVNNKSIFELGDIIEDFLNQHSFYLINIHEINFLPINEWDDAKIIGERSQSIVHENINLLEEVLDRIILKKIKLNIRYLEYCFLSEKYHKYLYNYLDHYFTNDWNPFYIYKEDILNENKNEFNLDKIKKDLFFKRKTQYYKDIKCIKCPWNIKCDGFKNKS